MEMEEEEEEEEEERELKLGSSGPLCWNLETFVVRAGRAGVVLQLSQSKCLQLFIQYRFPL